MLSLTINNKRKAESSLYNAKTKKQKKETIPVEDELVTDVPKLQDIADMLQMSEHDHVYNLFDYKLDNHIYFTSGVTKVSINKISKLIHEANREFKILKANFAGISCIDQSKIIPRPIYLHINSNGGSLVEGFRCMDIISNSEIPVYTIAEGVAISAASLMFMAGKKRYMTESSSLLIHQLSETGASGTYENMKDNLENSTLCMDRIVDVYFKASRGVMKKKQIRDKLKHDLLWDYETCKKYNLVDDLWKNENQCKN